ncbi:hypothetical protein ASD39_19185 [Sphingomonas sp. Root50]|nr:hypothetical protein ASD17_15790 [Sphingomonas sp. Root1294]KQY72075.1 hypothetical protein ASD39_19185 [Sphingomonas sp. Root50]KRB94656.1 hypothetical protein ASE22_01570 [Sphingomonas sp. Root720]
MAAVRLLSEGGSVERLACDIRSDASIAAAVAAIEPVGRLVNKAGFGADDLEAQKSVEGIRDIFETNFFGAVAMTWAARCAHQGECGPVRDIARPTLTGNSDRPVSRPVRGDAAACGAASLRRADRGFFEDAGRAPW